MSTLSALAVVQPRAVAQFMAALTAQRLHHGYIVVGGDVGAACNLVSAVAAALICRHKVEGDACGRCDACLALAGGSHPDVVSIAPNDKGVIAIDQVREAVGRISFTAAVAATKVVVVADADRATVQAQNALLKTLEEPPGATCFLLAATRLRGLLPTVRSRCALMRLVGSDKINAWRQLQSTGMPESVARMLAPVVGSERARELQEVGVSELLAKLEQALAANADWNSVLAIAIELGQDRELADTVLALLEVKVRDSLALHYGAPADMLYTQTLAPAGTASGLVSAAKRLSWLRRMSSLHINRSLAIEAVLRDLHAHEGLH